MKTELLLVFKTDNGQPWQRFRYIRFENDFGHVAHSYGIRGAIYCGIIVVKLFKLTTMIFAFSFVFA